MPPLYAIAYTRLTGYANPSACQLYRQLGSADAIYQQRHHLHNLLPDASPRLAEQLADWSAALERAKRETDFMERHHIKALCLGDAAYPQRLAQCADAPLVLYYLGNADLNQLRIVSIVGTRRCTVYGQDLVRRFVADLRQTCPQVLVVSGLAYGIDISAHRCALQQGYPTVGVLAHGLDELYPPRHRETATQMVGHGGLLTEYMSATRIDKQHFVRRNRIVAGIADATLLVESAAHGGGLITARMAADYGRQVMAFPGAVGAEYSAGCNNLIRDGGARLVTSASDFANAMGWQTDAVQQAARQQGIARELFPQLSANEQRVVQTLGEMGDFQLNQLANVTQMPIGTLAALLFALELKGVVKQLAGGVWHLLK